MKRTLIAVAALALAAITAVLTLPAARDAGNAPTTPAAALADAPAALEGRSTATPGTAPGAPATAPVPAAAPTAAPSGPATDFAQWLREYQASGGRPATLTPDQIAEGRRLAEARRPVMKQLMRDNPWQALDQSLKWHEWAALPPEIQALVEKPFSAAADFQVVPDCRPPNARVGRWQAERLEVAGQDYDAFVYGRRAQLTTKLGTPLQGFALDGQAALWESPAYPLAGRELLAVQGLFPDGNPRNRSWLSGKPIAGEPVAALMGGRVHYFADPAEVSTLARTIADAEQLRSPYSVSGAIAGAMGGDYFDTIAFERISTRLVSAWTETPKRVLGLRLAYSDAPAVTPYTQPVLLADLQSSSNSIRTMSFTKTHLIPTITGILVLPGNKAFYETNSDAKLAGDALAAAAAAGFVPGSYDMYVYCFPALARIGGTPAFANVNGPHQWVNGLQQASINVHEFGHNYGLGHANSWLAATGNGFAGHGVEHQEYGDVFDVMGNDRYVMANGQNIYPPGHFSMRGKALLHWIETGEVQEVTTNGVYRVRRFDHQDSRVSGGGTLALKVNNATGDELWVGYRRNFVNSGGGAYIVWANDPVSHRLLDTTPLTVGDRARDKEDAVLPPCQTFLDPSGSVRITTLGQGGASPNEYIDVEVTLISNPPPFQVFTTAARTTPGLVGSYVNTTLRGRAAMDDWRSAAGVTISGTRVDPAINFPDSGWGARAPVGVTGGTDADWENFSVQWDGYLVVNQGVRLATRSDDGSRMWIDLNGDASFAGSGPEFVNNNWGFGQPATLGSPSGFIPPGTYRIRIQYEEGNGLNSCELLGFPSALFDVFVDAGQTTNGLAASFVNSSLRAYAPQDDWRVTQPISGRRVDAYPAFLGNGWGSRSSVGITGGTDDDWEQFSVQWDGWLRVHQPTRFATISDDGSRMWIDIDGNGSFSATAPEFINNHWGSGQGDTIGDYSGIVQPGLYRCRIQYEEAVGGNHFQLAGLPAEVPGLDRNGLSFDGANDYVSANLGSGLASNYTFAAWVNLRTGSAVGGTRMGVLSSSTCGGSAEVLIRANTGNAADPQFLELGRCSAYNGIASTTPIPLNQWTHVAVTVSAAKLVTYYINGQLAGAWNAGAADTTIGPSITLGDNTAVRRFDGQLDEVQIWRTALSAAEIQAYMGVRLSGREPNLAALWHFDEGYGTTTADSTGNGRTGTLVNGPQWQATYRLPAAGYAVCFDGVDDYITIPGAGLFLPTDEITVEFWQRAYEFRQQFSFGLSTDQIGNRVSSHIPWINGRVYWDFGDINGPGRLEYVPGVDVTGRWQHWALVSSRGGSFQRIYRNGVQEAADGTAGQFARFASALQLGAAAGSFLKGELDEFRIWQVARSQAQIQAGMNCQLGVPQSGLWAYWRFDEGGGTNVYDLSGNGRHGVLMNGTAWTESGAPLRDPAVQPAPLLVTTVADSGPGSLRQAILTAAACAGDDVITFHPSLAGQVIRLTSTQLDLSDPTGSLLISAAGLPAGSGGVTLSGEGARRVFNIVAGTTVLLDSLTISNGVGTAGFFPGNGGGGIYSEGDLTLNNCTFVRNVIPAQAGAISIGGALAAYRSTVKATNCTFANNTNIASATAFGGAMCGNASTFILRHCTIAGNSATGGTGGNGGGILMDALGTVNLGHCIVAGNVGSTAADVSVVNGSVVPGTYNLVGTSVGNSLVNGVNGNLVGSAASPLNPVLGPLQNNGSRTPTMLPLLGSPALDAGDSAITGFPALDQRGGPRIAATRIDIGAVEAVRLVVSAPASVVRCAGDSVTLTATVTSGETPISVSWSKDGVPIPGANSLTYTKSGLAIGDAGDYCATVSSPSYQTTVCTALAVPTVTLTPMTDQLVCTGTTVRLDAGLVSGGATLIFTNDFNGGIPAGMTLTGSASVGDGYLKLTPAAGGLQGTALLSDFTGGRPVTEFTARFVASLFGGSAPPADGFSFNLVPPGAPALADGAEEGTTTGLSVAFDTWDNGAAEAPAIDVKWNGVLVASRPFQVSQSPGVVDAASARRDVFIQLHPNGTLDVRYGTNVIFDHLATPYQPITSAQWFLAGRTGGAIDNHWIDDLRLEVPPAYGSPVTYVWRKNGVPIPGQTNDVLQLANTAVADSGTYSVVVRSSCNTVTNSAAVNVVNLTPVVSNLNDSGPGSLRQAIINVNLCNGPGVITFTPGLTGEIRLLSALPTVTANTTILGPGTNVVTVSGRSSVSLFSFAAGTTNRLSGLRLASGVASLPGAAIRNAGSLALDNLLVVSNRTTVNLGGAVASLAGASMTVSNCVFANNEVRGGDGASQLSNSNGGPGGGGAGLGGAIYSDGATLTLSGCQFAGNRATGGNGGSGDRNSLNAQAGLPGGGPNPGSGGSIGAAGNPGGFGGGGGGGAGSFNPGFAGGPGGFGGGGGAGGARGGGGDGGAPGPGGLFGGNAGPSFSSRSGGGGGGAGLGGALFIRSGTVTVVNCRFVNNLATNGTGGVGSFGVGNGANGQGVGGAIFNLDAKLVVVNSQFNGNDASTDSDDVSASTVVTTLADSGPGSLRQALCNAAARPGADTITFAPALNGQVIRLTTSELLINDTSGRVTITADGLPAGVVISGEGARRVFRVANGSTATLVSLTISNGFAPGGTFAAGGGGGGIFNQGGLVLRNCAVVRNTVPSGDGFAGGIGNYGGVLSLTNSTLAGNSAWVAGAIYNYLGSCALSHCTVASNIASSAVGGVATESGPLSIGHSVFANSLQDLRPTAGTTIASDGYNLVRNGAGSGLVHGANGDLVGTAAAPIEPRLGPLQNNGGPTLTMLPTAGSPALNAGNPSLIGLGLTDQRGFPRIAGGRIDIGSVENCLGLFYPIVNSTAVDGTAGSVAQFQGSGVPLYGFDRYSVNGQSLALNDPVNTASNYYRLRTGTTNNSVRDLGLAGDFTVSLWVWQRGGATTNGWKVLLGQTGAGGGADNPVFGLFNGKLYLSYWGNDLPGNRVVSPFAWTHVAWTRKAHGGQLALYVNGQLDASTVGRAHAPRAGDLLIGFSEALAGSYFQGALDDIAIYCEALSPNQIAALATNTPLSGVLPPTVLTPSLAAAGACDWSVREIYAHTNDPVVMPYDLPSALWVASSTSLGKVTNYSSPVINRYDPNTNPGGIGLFGSDTPYALDNLTPQGLINGDDNYFVIAARTTIRIAEEDDYTFGFNTDDGGQLRVIGAQFKSSTDLGVANVASPAHQGDTLSFPANRPPAVTLGVTHLLPGTYDVEFISWEQAGGAGTEVFATRGARDNVGRPLLGVYNTGVDNAGNVLAGGVIDGHFRLVVNPDGGSPNAFVHLEPLPAWLPNSAQSKWIAPRASTGAGLTGTYTYRLIMDLTGRDPRSVRLSGRWAADDTAEIRVNGVSSGQTAVNQWFDWTSFQLSGANANFVRGTNTIDFVVQNTGSWNGVRVEFQQVSVTPDGFQLLKPSLFTRPLLTITPVSATQVRVDWTPGDPCQQLEAAPAVTGPWSVVPGAVSGQVFTTSPAYRFFRIAQ